MSYTLISYVFIDKPTILLQGPIINVGKVMSIFTVRTSLDASHIQNKFLPESSLGMYEP